MTLYYAPLSMAGTINPLRISESPKVVLSGLSICSAVANRPPRIPMALGFDDFPDKLSSASSRTKWRQIQFSLSYFFLRYILILFKQSITTGRSSLVVLQHEVFRPCIAGIPAEAQFYRERPSKSTRQG